MSAALARARLYLVAGAALIFSGGLLVAIGHWNRAETDRAFVEAAERAMRVQGRQQSNNVRYWTPSPGESPDAGSRVRLEVGDRLRQMPTVLPSLPQRPPSSDVKTPAAPR